MHFALLIGNTKASNCPKRMIPQLEEGRRCRPRCEDICRRRDGKPTKDECICDGVCGMSCIHPSKPFLRKTAYFFSLHSYLSIL